MVEEEEEDCNELLEMTILPTPESLDKLFLAISECSALHVSPEEELENDDDDWLCTADDFDEEDDLKQAALDHLNSVFTGKTPSVFEDAEEENTPSFDEVSKYFFSSQEASRKQWRACLVCGLIKTNQQFKTDGCDNYCFDILSNSSASDLTSAVFDGVIAITQPKKSWVAKWQRNDQNRSGLYAIRVSGKLPEECIETLADKGHVYRPRDGSLLD